MEMGGVEWGGAGRKVKCMMGCGVGVQGGMWSGVEWSGVQGGMWSAARGGRRSGRQCGAEWGGMGWEEAKMACEITSDAILPI